MSIQSNDETQELLDEHFGKVKFQKVIYKTVLSMDLYGINGVNQCKILSTNIYCKN